MAKRAPVRQKHERTVVVAERCLKRDCRNEATQRGLCPSCYQRAWTLVEVKGETTWDELIEAGLILPKKRNTTEWFLTQLEQFRARRTS